MGERDLSLTSRKLPGGNFASALFDSQLVQLSDRAGASRLIGEAWSEVAAAELERWVGSTVPMNRNDLLGGVVTAIHRIDTLPGVAARASRLGLKNPDFLLLVSGHEGSVVLAVDAKFSIETALDDQVSEEATSRLFEEDEGLARLLPSLNGSYVFGRGLFVCPDYSLTHAMFRHRVGHRRMSVQRSDVVLVETNGADMFALAADTRRMQLLIDLDTIPLRVWDSLLASQYYFRMSRAMLELALEERRPLFGHHDPEPEDTDGTDQIVRRSQKADSAWALLVAWDRDTEHIRRQRQALHQVVGMPVSSAELRELSDVVLADVAPELRPSRNQVRKALGSMFTSEVLAETGVIQPGVIDFSAELERVATVSRNVAERYLSDIETIVRDIVVAVIAKRQDTEGTSSADEPIRFVGGPGDERRA